MKMKTVFFVEVFSLACFVVLSQVTAKVRLMLARLASVRWRENVCLLFNPSKDELSHGCLQLRVMILKLNQHPEFGISP